MVSVYACVHMCMCVVVCRHTCIIEHTCVYEPICGEAGGQTSGAIPQVPSTLDFALFVCVHVEYMCLICICSIGTHICLFYVPLCVHTETKEKWWEPSFLIPSLIPLRQGPSLDPQLG